MKKLFILLLLTSVAGACISKNWHSDSIRDVTTYVKKVDRKPGKQKYTERLQLAYKEQQNRILLEIASLEKAMKPFYWEEVYARYKTLNEMAAKIENCSECRHVQMPVFYEVEQRAARNLATEDRIEAGRVALGLDSKTDAQRAYHNFQMAKKLSPSRKELDLLISESLAEGTVRIVLEGDYKNDKDYVKDIEKSLKRQLPVSAEAKPFFQFYSPDEAIEMQLKPDYVVRFGYEILNVGMEQKSCSEETFNVDVKVGEKKIDSVNVKAVYEKVTAKVSKCKKSVSAQGKVWIQILDFQSDEIVVKDSFHSNDDWVNEWVVVSGDSRALPGGASSSGSEDIAPTRWRQFDNVTANLTGSLAWKIRTFIRSQSKLASL